MERGRFCSIDTPIFVMQSILHHPHCSLLHRDVTWISRPSIVTRYGNVVRLCSSPLVYAFIRSDSTRSALV